MKIITLPPYGVGATELHVMIETIVTFYYINYNGHSGTEIKLSNGQIVRTSMNEYDLKKALEGE